MRLQQPLEKPWRATVTLARLQQKLKMTTAKDLTKRYFSAERSMKKPKMTYYVDGLNHTIRMVVARHRENVPRRVLTFEGLCHFERSKDDAHRARMEQISTVMSTPTTNPRGLPHPTRIHLFQETPRAGRTPNPVLSPTPRTSVDVMDE